MATRMRWTTKMCWMKYRPMVTAVGAQCMQQAKNVLDKV